MSRLWESDDDRIDSLVLRYTVGDDHLLDARLVPYDVRASIAHAQMLSEQGYLERGEFEQLSRALTETAQEHEDGEWEIALEDEDAHTAIENRLIEKAGAVGQKIHLGRSRNDQVLAALRLYMMDAIHDICEKGEAVLDGLDTVSAEQGHVHLPGYTHMQRAMPSSVALWANAYHGEISDDLAGLQRAEHRVNLNPLGSAAGYGVPVIQVDRERTSELLGFAAPQDPVTSVQLSRGKAEATVLFELALLMQDLGRLAEDLCLFATQEFGFMRLPDGFTTGSSIMPQKRNPDLFELVRGRSAQAAAELQSVLALTAKMPSGYHRELQLIKAPLFRGIDSAADTLEIMAHAVPEVRFNPATTEQAIDSSMYATEEAYRLVESEGIPFREAYRRIAENYHGAPDLDPEHD